MGYSLGNEREGNSWGLSSRHLELLGEIAAGSAMLEQNLGATLRGQLGLDAPLSNILVTGLPIQILIKKVLSLAKYQLEGSTVLRDLEQWAPRARAVANKRNAALHSVWLSNPTPGTLMSASFPKAAAEEAFISRTWTESELQELVVEIGELIGELVTYWSRMGLIAGQLGETPVSRP